MLAFCRSSVGSHSASTRQRNNHQLAGRTSAGSPGMAVNQPQLLDFSKTQRLVFLIDLQPLLTVQNPTAYIATVTSAASRLLHFPPLSTSLFAYKLFFSSLSPLRSPDVIPRHLCSPSISFNFPLETLASLSTNLNSICTLLDLPNPPGRPLVLHIQSALLQLIHDYGWENEHGISVGRDKSMFSEFLKIPSNLVLLFSPLKFLLDSVSFHDSEELLLKIDGIFCDVREAFLSRDLHVCWIDVNSDKLQLENINDNELDNKYIAQSQILVNCIRKMGWGFCSTNWIVLGSALLPLGLIYPKIGLPFDFVNFGGLDESKCGGQLNLEILDVKGMPLEYKCCDLEFVKLKSLPSVIRNNDAFGNLESRDSQGEAYDKDSFLSQFGDGSIKLYVKAVLGYGELEKIGCYSEHVFVRERLEEMGKSRKKCSGDFFADRVLESLHKDMGRATYRSQIPTWQIFLSFLHINGYWAVVSLLSSNGHTCIGSLKPFTAHLAILSIMGIGNDLSNRISQSKLWKIDDQVHDTYADDLPDSNPCFGSQTESSTSGGNYEQHAVGKRKKKRIQLYQQMTWSSFCEAAFEGSQIDLFEVYVAGQFEKSKKLKFLKCWMKQIDKIDPYCLTLSHGSKSTEDFSASCVPSATEEAMLISSSETSESFFNNLTKRIQQGLESGIDLQILAQRVVKSSICWLHQKHETKNNSIDQSQMQIQNGSCSDAFDIKVIELLLREPKEMKEMHQDQDSPSKASQPPSSSENIVRDYELQIFLRMEIMRSDVSAMIEESRKQKLLKQICSLLEIIQYLVAGGIHGHISLYDYVERTIKARYSEELEDVVRKIYTKMDLLPFGDEDETPNLLFNSEDSSQSWKDKHEKAEANSISQSISAEDEYSNCEENKKEMGENDHSQMLNKARERRERARRFVSFTSRVQDLQRVWAPKQQQKIKDRFDSLPKKSKRKDWHEPGYSVVRETPLTGNKRACAKRDKEQEDFRNSYSVSKALFQDICPEDKSTA